MDSLKKVVYETGAVYLVRKELTEKYFDEIEKTKNKNGMEILLVFNGKEFYK